MHEPLIRLENVTKVYNKGEENEYRALKGIDLIIKQNEFVAIMGPSGSGKSTMMNILGALDVPTSGNYFVNGTEISQFSAAQLAEFRNRDVGFIFQQFNLLPRINVLRNVMLPTLYGHLNEPQREAMRVLKKVELGSKAENKPNQLSGGEMQRVAIARALIMKPSIIMADEPTGNLDTKTSKGIMQIFKDVHAEGNTIILITHEEDIAAYAQRIIRIKDGQLIN